MSGLVPGFQSGSNLIVIIGNVMQANLTSISLNRSMTNGAVGGIGGFSYDALEALGYSSSASLTLTRYSKATVDAINGKAGYQVPARTNGFNNPGTDGNSLLHPSQFNPAALLTGKTFDIIIGERLSQDSNEFNTVLTLKDCRLNSYSLSFSPNSLVSENLGVKCIRIIDAADGV